MSDHFIHFTPEAIPFNKLGGLSDFVDGITSIQKENSKVDIILTTCQKESLRLFDKKRKIIINFSLFDFDTYVYETSIEGKNFYYIELEFVDESIQFTYSENEEQVYLQLLLKSLVAKEIINQIKTKNSIVVCHEWPTSFLFLHRKEIELKMHFMVHNFHHQGPIGIKSIKSLPENYFNELNQVYNKYGFISLSHYAIDSCDKMITVSNVYLKELLKGESIHPYDEIIKEVQEKTHGVVNPVKKNYLHDFELTRNKEKLIETKKIAKEKVLKDLNLKSKKIILFISRPVEQKGFQLFLNRSEFTFYKKLKKKGYSIIFFSDSGSELINFKIKKKFEPILAKYNNVRLLQNYNDEYASILLQAADIHFMPSVYEPCGLSQQYAMLNGAIPIVNPVGGLAETVVSEELHPNEGTGFWLDDFNLSNAFDKVSKADDIITNEKKYNDFLERMINKPKYWDEMYKEYQLIFKD